jgi:glycosyltransferase involved in cell wall biosynthesis
MKIAIFYPRNVYASWYTLGGYVRTLTTMGHEVIDCPFPGNQVHDVDAVRASLPTIETLLTCDVVILAFAEYLWPWLDAVYTFDKWQPVLQNKRVIGRMDESMDRTDLALFDFWPQIARWFNYSSFPAQQDAEEFKGQFLPFGADLTMFNADRSNDQSPIASKYQIGFVGTMYPLRHEYLKRLAPALDDSITFNVGTVMVQDVSGIRPVESTKLLAEEYRAFSIFFCLPPLSRLLVCKVFEVMACGTMVMFPKLPGHTASNLSIFEDGKEIVYYEYGMFGHNAAQIRHYLQNAAERAKIAKAGCDKVQAQYSLEDMLANLLTGAGFSSEEARPVMTKEYRLKHNIGQGTKVLGVQEEVTA